MSEQDAVCTGGPGEPAEGADAGPADEYRKEMLMAHRQSLHQRASELLHAARHTVAASRHEAEKLAREALTEAAHAYWYAEETEAAGPEHKFLHQIGRWTRETFGCAFDWNGTSYISSCPVLLADKRFGASPTLVATQILCSVCDQDLSECAHSRERLYIVRGDRTTSGSCRVCNTRDDCEHDPNKLYAAPVYRIRKGMKLIEASFVDVPADPTARPTELRKYTDDLMRAVRRAFPNVPKFCDHCREPYHGLPRPLDLNDSEALFWIS